MDEAAITQVVVAIANAPQPVVLVSARRCMRLAEDASDSATRANALQRATTIHKRLQPRS